MIYNNLEAEPIQLVEELKIKELATVNAMMVGFLRKHIHLFQNNLLPQSNPSELIAKSISPINVAPIELPSPVPLSPLEFNNNITTNNNNNNNNNVVVFHPITVFSSPTSSPISSPSTSSVDGVIESEDSERRPHQCPDCLKRFRFKSNLFEHKTLHQHATPFVCPFCSKTCRLKGNLKKHLQVHVSSSEALEELWKSRFSRSSGRPRKQLSNTSQQPVNNLHQQQLPTPLATYASPINPISGLTTVTPLTANLGQPIFDLNFLLSMNANQQLLSNSNRL